MRMWTAFFDSKMHLPPDVYKFLQPIVNSTCQGYYTCTAMMMGGANQWCSGANLEPESNPSCCCCVSYRSAPGRQKPDVLGAGGCVRHIRRCDGRACGEAVGGCTEGNDHVVPAQNIAWLRSLEKGNEHTMSWTSVQSVEVGAGSGPMSWWRVGKNGTTQ